MAQIDCDLACDLVCDLVCDKEVSSKKVFAVEFVYWSAIRPQYIHVISRAVAHTLQI